MMINCCCSINDCFCSCTCALISAFSSFIVIAIIGFILMFLPVPGTNDINMFGIGSIIVAIGGGACILTGFAVCCVKIFFSDYLL